MVVYKALFGVEIAPTSPLDMRKSVEPYVDELLITYAKSTERETSTSQVKAMAVTTMN